MKPVFNDNLLFGKTAAVAVSGGSDSVALLHYLSENRASLGFSLAAITVNHGIRGAEADSDVDFVTKLCNEWEIPLFTYNVDSKKRAETEGLSLEQAARALRYECFFDCIEKGNCDVVFTAHHQGDNVETILFNLFRGSSLSGMCGMEPVSYGGRIMRPLLDISKQEINSYIKKNGIAFRTDSTNFSAEYTRNFLRLEILPALSEKFGGFSENIIRFSKSAKDDDEYLYSLSDELLTKEGEGFRISPCGKKPLFFRAVLSAIKSLGIEKDYAKAHLESVFGLQTLEAGSSVDLPNGIRAFKDYSFITVEKAKESSVLTEVPFALGDYEQTGEVFRFSLTDKMDGEGLFLDYEKLPCLCVLRGRKEGDIFKRYKGGTKKLKEYLIDKKLIRRERGGLLLLAKENIIYAVCGAEISDLVKVDGNTKKILRIQRLKDV